MNYMFQMNIDTALEFYIRCREQHAQTLEDRNKILVQLVEEGRIKSVTATNRSKEQIVQDAAKNYGHVLDLTKIKENNSNDRTD
jgi:hypothetical protein